MAGLGFRVCLRAGGLEARISGLGIRPEAQHAETLKPCCVGFIGGPKSAAQATVGTAKLSCFLAGSKIGGCISPLGARGLYLKP